MNTPRTDAITETYLNVNGWRLNGELRKIDEVSMANLWIFCGSQFCIFSCNAISGEYSRGIFLWPCVSRKH